MPLLLQESNILKIILILLKKNPKVTENSSEAGEIKKDYYIYKLKSDLSSLRQEMILTELDFKNLRKALNFVIFVDYPKLTDLAEYLKGIAKISNTLNIPIPWILPIGLVINQQFYDKKTLKVKPFVYQKNLVNLTVLNKNQYNKNKQKNSTNAEPPTLSGCR